MTNCKHMTNERKCGLKSNVRENTDTSRIDNILAKGGASL